MREYNSLTRCLFFDIEKKKLFVILEKDKDGKKIARLPKAGDFSKEFLDYRSSYESYLFMNIPDHFDINELFRKVPGNWDYLYLKGKECDFNKTKKTKLTVWNLMQPKDKKLVEEFCEHLSK